VDRRASRYRPKINNVVASKLFAKNVLAARFVVYNDDIRT
jgi:hypothetical protein